MADNVFYRELTAGEIFATDEVTFTTPATGPAHVQKVKLFDPTDKSEAPHGVESNPFRVKVLLSTPIGTPADAGVVGGAAGALIPQARGLNTTIGAAADAAIAGDGSGTLMGHARGINKNTFNIGTTVDLATAGDANGSLISHARGINKNTIEIGAAADAAVVGDISGKVIPQLRGINKQLARYLDGTWGYTAGSLTTTGTVTRAGRCVGLRVYANGADSSFTINGGDTITLRSNTGLDLNPNGQFSTPLVTWVSGSIDIVIETLS